jgi:hypothetical protein
VSEPKPKSFEISKWAAWEAYLRVRANKGAAGVDEQSVAEFERGLKGNLYKLWNRLSSGSYMPPPVRAVEIPKRVCNQPAGWGTPYGHGRCKLHGGATPTHLRAAQRREAERGVASLGLPREVEPHTGQASALVHRALRAARGPGGARRAESPDAGLAYGTLSGAGVLSRVRSRSTIRRGEAVPSSRPRIAIEIASPVAKSVAPTPNVNAVMLAMSTASPVTSTKP